MITTNYSQKIMDLAASLWLAPATRQELYDRLSHFGGESFVDNLMYFAFSKNWIYERGTKMYCYKSTYLNVLVPNGYELSPLPYSGRNN